MFGPIYCGGGIGCHGVRVISVRCEVWEISVGGSVGGGWECGGSLLREDGG